MPWRWIAHSVLYSPSTYFVQLSQFALFLSRTFSGLTLNRSITTAPQLGFACISVTVKLLIHKAKTEKCSSSCCTSSFAGKQSFFFFLLLLHSTHTVRLLGSIAGVLIWFSSLCCAVHVQQLTAQSLLLSSDPFTKAISNAQQYW